MINIHRILCPVDFSECSDHALEYALAFAEAYQAQLEVFHVVEPLMFGTGPENAYSDLLMQEIRENDAAHLKETTERALQRYSRVSGFSETGTPFVEIIRRAKAQDVDLIVMGTHGRAGLPHVLIGSCAERVVRKAPCPVLTVKHPEHDFVMP